MFKKNLIMEIYENNENNTNTVKCLWCNAKKQKSELNVIYGKNSYFNRSIFYGCNNEHINLIKQFLEKTEKYHMQSFSSLIISLIIYPALLFFFKNYYYRITIIISIDFGSGLIFFPFALPRLTEKLGIQKYLFIFRTLGFAILIMAIILIIKYFSYNN